MAFKDKETAAAYYRKYYFEKKKPKRIPKPRVLLTKEEKLAKKRAWYHKDVEKNREVARKSYERNKEKIFLRNKIWREKNKEKLKESSKIRSQKWYQENKERKQKSDIIWKEDNPEKVREIRRRFSTKHSDKIKIYDHAYNRKIEGRYRMVKDSARKRNYSFELTLEQYQHIIELPCVYCGENEKKIGVDRIDNTVGYIIQNSAPCCTLCNMMKKTMTVEDFISHVQKIADFSK